MNEESTDLKKTVLLCLVASLVINVAVAMAISYAALIVKKSPAEIVVKKTAKREVLIALVRPSDPLPPQLVPVRKAPALATPPKTNATSKPQPTAAAKREPEEKVEKKPEGDISRKALVVAPEFERTTEQQATGQVPETNLQGERDTIAASNADASAAAPDRAAVKGENDRHDELVDTSYQDGAFEHMNDGGKSKPAPVKPPVKDIRPLEPEDPSAAVALKAQKQHKEVKSSVLSTPEAGTALDKGKLANLPEVADPQKQFLETQEKVLTAAAAAQAKKRVKEEPLSNEGDKILQKTIANAQPDPNAPKQKPQDEKRKKKVAEASKPKEKNAKNSKKGFRSQARARVMAGAISRHSKIASRNVKATPLGKYLGVISKRVEQEWQRRCIMHADLTQPGSLRISLTLSASGKVIQIRTLQKIYGNESNVSLTHQALRSVRYPAMSSAVKKVQNGDPLELIYNFDF